MNPTRCDHNINPDTDRCVLCGKNRFQREHWSPRLTGALVTIRYQGKEIEGRVELASPDGDSLALSFDGFLGGYCGAIAVVRMNGVYRDLICGEPVEVTVHQKVAE